VRKILSLLFVVLLLCGCQPGSAQEKSAIKIGISVYDQYDTFIGLVTERVHKFAREKEADSGISITILQEAAGNSQLTQNTQVSSFIRNKCDVICVNLVDRTDASMIIDLAESADIPVIFFNRELVEADLARWDKLYYVGAEALESGKLQGQILVGLAGRDFESVDRSGDGVLQYVILEGEAGHQDAIMRTRYCVSTVEDAGIALDRLGDAIANWNRSQAQDKMSQFLDAYSDRIEVVFCNNDEMALGVIEALEAHPMSYWPVILGIDGTPYALETIRSGKLAGSVLNDYYRQARGMFDLAFALAAGEELPYDVTENNRYIRLPYQMITPDNVEEFADM